MTSVIFLSLGFCPELQALIMWTTSGLNLPILIANGRGGFGLLCTEYWWPIMRTDAEGLEEICRLASDGRLKIPVGKTFPLESAAEAHHARDSKSVNGKVVLEVDGKV